MTNREKRFWSQAIVDMHFGMRLVLGDPCTEAAIPPKALAWLKANPNRVNLAGRRNLNNSGEWIVRLPYFAIDGRRVVRTPGSGLYVFRTVLEV